MTWAFEGCERFRHMNKETKETGEVRAALRLCPSQAKSSPGQVWAGGPRLHQHRLSCGLSEPIKPQVAVKPSGGGVHLAGSSGRSQTPAPEESGSFHPNSLLFLLGNGSCF